MLRLKPNPTFRAKALIPDPGGPAFDLDCEFKHMGKAEFAAFSAESGKRSDIENVKAILVRWHDEAAYSEESLAALLDAFPGAAFAISEAYGRALYQGRKGN